MGRLTGFNNNFSEGLPKKLKRTLYIAEVQQDRKKN